MKGARSMATKQFTLLSAEEAQQFDNPTTCLHHVLDKGGRCGPNCTLVVSSPVGVSVKETLQQAAIPSLGKASLILNTDLFAVEPAVPKQKSTTSLGYKSKSSSSKLVILQSAETSQNGLEQHLYHAVSIGNPEALLAVLESPDKPSNLNISLVYPAGGGAVISPLGLAAFLGNTSCLEILLNAGADVDWQDEQTGYTALHWASLGGVKACVKCLVKRNADLNKKDKQGFIALHYGVMQEAEVVSPLLHEAAEGVGLVQHTPTGVSPLMLAALLGSTDCLKLLLRHSQSASLKHHVDTQGLSVLQYATWSKVTKCVKAVLSHHAGVHLMELNDQWGRDCLHHAAAAGATDVIQLLLKKGAAVSSKDKSSMTCMHWAVMSSNVSCVKFLLECKDTRHLIMSCDAAGLTIMHYAVGGGNPDMIDLLINKDVDIAACDNSCFSVLLWATAFLLVDRVKELVGKGVDVQIDQSDSSNVQTSQSHWTAGLQPLHVAARVGSKELCELFLNAGAILQCCSNYGYTALHHASYYGHLDVVEFLLNKGAQVDFLTESNETGLHLAASQGHSQTVQVMLDHGADKLLAAGKEQNTPAHLAASAGHTETVMIFLRNGVPVDLLRSGDGRSLLHLAALNGHATCVCKLLQEGASLVIRDTTKEGFTALDLAMIHRHTACKDLLMQHRAPSGGGKFHQAAICIQAAWRMHKKKEREAVARFWAAHVILRCCKLWIMRTRAARLRKVRERVRHQAATLIQRRWRQFSAAKRRYESTYMKLKMRLQQEQLAVQLIMKELLEQEKSIRLPPATSTGNSISALHLLKSSQPLHPCTLRESLQNKKQSSPSSQSYSRTNSHKMNSSHRRSEAAISKMHSQKKLDSYIHHVVSNNLPPTAQVGGAVIRSPRLPLPPISLPSTAPPIITIPSKTTIPRINKEPDDTDINKTADASERCTHEDSGDTDINKVETPPQRDASKEPVDTDSPLQSDSNISIGSNEVIERDDHNNIGNNISADVSNATAPLTNAENVTSSSSPTKIAEDVSIPPLETDCDKQKVKPLISPVATRPLKKPLKHKRKVLPTTVSSPSLSDSSNKTDDSGHMAAAESLRGDKDGKLLPALKKKLPSNFDVITSLTGHKRRSEHDMMLDTHVTQLHNCAERHHKLRQVMELLEHAHQQGTAISTPEADDGTMDVAELRQHLHTALNEAVRLRAETESLRMNQKKLHQETLV